MKILQPLLLFTSLLALSGCEQDCNVGSGPLIPSPVEPQVVLVGKLASVGVSAMVRGGCPGNWNVDGVPQALRVELTDPDGQPVETESTLYQQASAGGSFHFTPDKPGRYHAITTFEPVGGFQQFDLYAMSDRSPELPLQTLARTCNVLERTDRGGWLCDSDFLRGNVVEQRFTGSWVTVTGDVVWVADTTRIQRFVDTGTRLELTASMEHTQGAPEFLQGSADELLIMHPLSFQLVTLTLTGQLRSMGASSWERGNNTSYPLGSRAVPLRRGDQLALVTVGAPSGGNEPRACLYRLEQGVFVRTSASCQTFPGEEVVGFEPGVLWLGTRASLNFASVRRLEWGDTGLVERGALPLGKNIELARQLLSLHTSLVPAIKAVPISYGSRSRSAVVAYSPAQGTLVLEMLDLEVSEPRASSRLFWGPNALDPHAGLRIRARPPPP